MDTGFRRVDFASPLHASPPSLLLVDILYAVLVRRSSFTLSTFPSHFNRVFTIFQSDISVFPAPPDHPPPSDHPSSYEFNLFLFMQFASPSFVIITCMQSQFFKIAIMFCGHTCKHAAWCHARILMPLYISFNFYCDMPVSHDSCPCLFIELDCTLVRK